MALRAGSSGWSRGVIALALLVSFASRTAHAEPGDGETKERRAGTSSARDDRATWSLWAVTGRAERARTSLTFRSPLARDHAAFRDIAETGLTRRLGLRAETGNVGPTTAFDPELALVYDVVSRRDFGIAVSAGYETAGFNLTPAVVSSVIVSRELGDALALVRFAYAQGVDLEERYGDVRWTLLRRIGGTTNVGVDARGRVDLERDEEEPTGEQDWELVAGPIASRSFGPLTVSGSLGMLATKLRGGDRTFVGAEATMAVGTTF